ncbi:MAG: type II toxin-antitoxin system RelE/ParE family toxin [Spirochaetota bacterium]|nr:type II toxin-antitoxin system RelE/ParE family toxin [Spirochaetota bacterium]
MSRVIVHRRAFKYIQKLPKEHKERIKEILKKLEINPMEFRDIRPMYGEWTGYYRIRVGNIRIIFWFDNLEDIVYIDHIGPRGNIYK